MPLPDFIIGGAPKCGTTALFRYLDQHPKVFTSNPKEPHFFATENEEIRGMSFDRKKYEELFGEAGSNQIAGEASTGYLIHAGKAAPRIRKTVPSARVIFLIRNPVHRDYSEFWFRVYRGDLPIGNTFSSYVSKPSHWIFHGSKSYVSGIRTFCSHFHEEQILVLLTDDLRKNTDEVLRRVCDHIGVDSDYSFDLTTRHNVTKYPRSVRLCRWIGRVAPGLSQWAAGTRWIRGLRSRLLFSDSAEKPPMRKADRERLAAHYEQEIDELEQLIGRDLSHWKEPT
jgi:hypothetical protein